MMPDPTVIGPLIFKRYDTLHALTQAPHTKRELTESLEIPRSTLSDILRELEHANLVQYSDGHWQTTFISKCMVHTHQQYVEHLSRLREMESLTDVLGAGSPLDCTFIIGADVHKSEAALPDEVMHVLLEAAESASRFRIFTPAAISSYVKPFYEHATTGDNPRIEVIVKPTLFEQLRANNASVMNDAVDDDRVTFFTAQIPVSFGLWIADDDSVGVLPFGESGIRGILTNDSAPALAWAEDQYEQVKQDADSVFFRGGTAHSTQPR